MIITCPNCDFLTNREDPVNCARCGKCLVTHHWRDTGGPLGSSFEAYATSIPIQPTHGKAEEGWRNGYGDAWQKAPAKAPAKAPPTCATCRFFQSTEPWPNITPDELAALTGQCKRRSPSPTAFHPWPRVVASEWCGEHEEGKR